MKIQNIIESFLFNSDQNLRLIGNPYIFSNKNNVIDGSITIINTDDDVKYVLDIELNIRTKSYKITDIDVQDHSNTYDGDKHDMALMQNYLNSNIDLVIQSFNNADDSLSFDNLDN